MYDSLTVGAYWHKPDHYFIFRDLPEYVAALIKVNLDLLRMDGLLTDEECRAEQTKDKTIDYAKLCARRLAVLKKAFVRFWKPQSYERFVEDNGDWLFPYAEFMARKQADKEFWIFVQYEFYMQW